MKFFPKSLKMTIFGKQNPLYLKNLNARHGANIYNT